MLAVYTPQGSALVRKQVEAGRQAYIVYPVIEGDKDDQPELDFAKDSAEAEEAGGPSFAFCAKGGTTGISAALPCRAK